MGFPGRGRPEIICISFFSKSILSMIADIGSLLSFPLISIFSSSFYFHFILYYHIYVGGSLKVYFPMDSSLVLTLRILLFNLIYILVGIPLITYLWKHRHSVPTKYVNKSRTLRNLIIIYFYRLNGEWSTPGPLKRRVPAVKRVGG